MCFRRSPTPPVQEPEPESEPERPAEEPEDTEDLRNKVNKLEEDVQHVSCHEESILTPRLSQTICTF